METNKNIMTAASIASELGVSVNFIYRELKAKRIPSQKIGDRYFTSRAQWEKFLAGEYQPVKPC